MSFQKFFANRFSDFLRATFDSPAEVAFVFAVTGRTAENWWNGLNAPNGAAVARAFLNYRPAAERHLGGDL